MRSTRFYRQYKQTQLTKDIAEAVETVAEMELTAEPLKVRGTVGR